MAEFIFNDDDELKKINEAGDEDGNFGGAMAASFANDAYDQINDIEVRRIKRRKPLWKRKKEKKIFFTIFFISLAVALISGVALYFMTRKLPVNLNHYVSVTFNESNGDISASPVFDSEGFLKRYGKKIRYMSGNSQGGTAAQQLISELQYGLSQYSGLTAGGTVTLTWYIDKSRMERVYDIALNYRDKSYKVPNALGRPTPSPVPTSEPTPVYSSYNQGMLNNLPTLSGSRSSTDISTLERLYFSYAQATSEIYASDAKYGPSEAIDGLIATSWQENVEGYGIGETITAYFRQETSISYIGILAGSFSSVESYYENDRLRMARIEFSNGEYIDYFFEDDPNLFLIQLSHTVYTNYVKIIIEDVYPGNTWDDSAIAEIMAFR